MDHEAMQELLNYHIYSIREGWFNREHLYKWIKRNSQISWRNPYNIYLLNNIYTCNNFPIIKRIQLAIAEAQSASMFQ